MRARLAALGVALFLAGCGADDEPAPAGPENTGSPSLASPTPTPTPTPPAAGTPPTATAPSAPEPPPDAEPPEAQEGGAGDEEAARSPVDLVLDAEGLTPPRVEVAAFLAIELRVRNDLPRAVRVRVAGTEVAFRVPAGATGEAEVAGRVDGGYTVTAGAAGRARIAVGAEPGP